MPSARPPARRCLGVNGKPCPRLIRQGSRCASCKRQHERARESVKTQTRKAKGQRTGSTRAWRKLRLQVFERDGWTCQSPGCDYQDRTRTGAGLHADHLVHRANGGPDAMHNLRTLCSRCNLKRGKQ